MLPLAGSQLPDSPEALTEALRAGLAAHELRAQDIAAEGVWPALASLRIDLTGAQISRNQRLPSPGETRSHGFSAARFDLVAAPARLESAPVQMSVRAEDAGFEFASDANGESLAILSRVGRGEVAVEVARADFERLVHALASEAASPHGVVIKETKVHFASRGPRAVSVTAEVTAKMFIATAVVTLSGDLDLDERLTARLSKLRFSGDGMVASLAGGFIRPQLARLEGRELPLMSFALGEIGLRDVELQTGDKLRLTARFGS